jgi:hypothetical protein
MAPDEVSEILTAVHNVDKRLALLDVRFEEHVRLQGTEVEFHAATCPMGRTVLGIRNDVDALASMQRVQGTDIKELKTWRREVDDDELVESAVNHERLQPVKWAFANVEKIMLAIVIAYLVFRFGL